MIETKNTYTPIIRKSDAWKLQALANVHKYKTVLYLRDVLDLSWSEIARRMNYCESYVHRTYVRAYMLMGKEVTPVDIGIPIMRGRPERKLPFLFIL